MYRYCLIIVLINAAILEGRSQIIPAPGAKLNYTQIMFEHPQVKGADAYVIQVAVDTTANTFAKPIAQRTDSSTAAIISHLQFGQEYLWRYCGVANGKKMNWQGPFKFEIIAADCIDTSICRVKVLINDTGANSGGLIILDRDQSIVDRDGNFVWYMPMDFTAQAVLHSHGKPGYGYSDLRITPAGNLTLLAGSQAMEVDLNGNIIWQAPPRSAFSPDTLKLDRPYDYHHCFEKLASGNYMVLGRKSVLKPAGSGYNDTAQTIVADEMILEFDTSGKLVWQWNSDVYFDSVEIKNLMGLKPDSGLIDLRPGGHLNAFYADEKNGFVYAGFRNVSRVIKIDKKTGQVVCEWGSGMKYHGAPNADGFFKKQHETTLLRDGNMAVFNNSGKCAGADSGMPPASSIVIFSQPSDTANSRLLWQFDCRFDTANNVSLTGGSIDELKNGNLLAGMGLVGRIFEISRNKKVVWQAAVELCDRRNGRWQPFQQYKAHYTSSLYPCYFSVQHNWLQANKKQAALQLQIFNDGTEDDSYQVYITPGTYHIHTDILAAGKSTRLQIMPDQIKPSAGMVKITVVSNTNPAFKRTIQLDEAQ